MTDRVLIDSNVVVYCLDPSDREKQRRSAETLDRLEPTGRGVLSTQVLGEFFRVVTQKLSPPLTAADACDEVARLARAWAVLPVTALVVLEAARGVREFRLSYWDAQLWATARLNQIDVVLSEDFRDGHVLDGVRFVNPLRLSFDVAALVG